MANAALEFMLNVSRHCRKLIETAGLAIRDQKEYATQAARAALKTALKAQQEALEAVLPADFPGGRRGDLARHIHFCEPGDWNDIVFFDVPDIMAKAEAYATELPRDDLGDLDVFIHARFRPRLAMTLQQDQPDFHALILTCSVDLATLFRQKSGAADDSDGEIGRIFSPNNPVLRVPAALATETERNIQRGSMLLMQGWRAFIRNPHAHGERPTDREYAMHALMLMSFLARIIDGATRVV
ncbi:TIGR02391 family protein [Sphingomonas corticis]|uniref:TIGR02391 family protein n=1 Tax=Sphingomonas corticis TaxID=2722791 RepID=A0ABX1CSS3_9SPHN|nr:TIGR02391 family protein [Sphingomonas corticis]NJR79345.1 TIGR02391 family protein [Sphingomonas corticis]